MEIFLKFMLEFMQFDISRYSLNILANSYHSCFGNTCFLHSVEWEIFKIYGKYLDEMTF